MIVIKTMLGLGDNLYFRPALKWLPTYGVSLITPWPQVYHDIPGLKFMRPPQTRLRTQKYNVDAIQDSFWATRLSPDYILSYDFEQGSCLHNFFMQTYPIQPTWVDNAMAVPESWIESARTLLPKTNKPICLVRPNTLRLEWLAPARNCKSEYLQKFINDYKDEFCMVSLANLSNKLESLDGHLENLNLEILNTTYEQTVGLFVLSNLILCGHSFWVPLAQILNKHCIVIYGAHEPYDRINDKRVKCPNLRYVEPTPFDRCWVRKPNAFKDISEDVLEATFKEVVDRCLQLGVV